MSEIPKAPIARIIKESGAERVSEDAKAELAEALEEIARNISIKANEAARLAKNYISGALADMLDIGKGSGPMNHAFAIEGEFNF